ncbi:hypothetical protein LTR65_007383 [Meristemomyces frigidus]
MFSDGFGIGDAFVSGSTVLTVVQSVLSIAATGEGLGKSFDTSPKDIHDWVQQRFYAAQLLFTIALGLSKMAIGLFLRRLTPDVQQRKLFLGSVGILAV